MGRLRVPHIGAGATPRGRRPGYRGRAEGSLRDANGRHEIDLHIEAPDGQIIAIDVKATAAPSRADARHLEWLRERLGTRLAVGLLVHTGPAS